MFDADCRTKVRETEPDVIPPSIFGEAAKNNIAPRLF